MDLKLKKCQRVSSQTCSLLHLMYSNSIQEINIRNLAKEKELQSTKMMVK